MGLDNRGSVRTLGTELYPARLRKSNGGYLWYTVRWVPTETEVSSGRVHRLMTAFYASWRTRVITPDVFPFYSDLRRIFCTRCADHAGLAVAPENASATIRGAYKDVLGWKGQSRISHPTANVVRTVELEGF